MPATAVSTIALIAPIRTIERLANAALSPGHVMELMSTNKFRKNTRIARSAVVMVALEKEYDGKGVETAYAADDQVLAGIFARGSEVALRLPANAAAIVVGDVLETDGTGCVRKQVQGALITSVGTGDGTIADGTGTYSQTIFNNNFKDVADAVNSLTGFAIALEAIDNSAVGNEVFIRALIV